MSDSVFNLTQPRSQRDAVRRDKHCDEGHDDSRLPWVSLIIPAYNETAILAASLTRLCRYLRSLETDYRWELIIVNDGSSDDTGARAERFANDYAPNSDLIRILHHSQNRGLGHALRTAFAAARGDYLVTLDIDLSYEPAHIGQLLQRIRASKADMVLASPYMKGGKASHIPLLRRVLSLGANRFLSLASHGQLSTLTGMVRVYRSSFIQSLDLRASGMEIMPEIIYKAMLVGGRIEEIPAHLDWRPIQQLQLEHQHAEPANVAPAPKRRSSMRLMRHFLATLLSGFLFRPAIFFLFPGLLLLFLGLWLSLWMGTHFFDSYWALTQYADATVPVRASAALDQAFDQHTHTFVIGLLTLMLAIQLISLGILAMQSKHYFEEIYHLGSSIRQSQRTRAPQSYD